MVRRLFAGESRIRTMEGRMADIDWKPLPTGLCTPPAVFAEVGNLFLQAFTDDGVPTWEISKKTGERGRMERHRQGDCRRLRGGQSGRALRSESNIVKTIKGHGDVVQDRPGSGRRGH